MTRHKYLPENALFITFKSLKGSAKLFMPATVSEKTLTMRKVLTTDDFYALREQWNSLLKVSRTSSHFLTWEWLWSWWNAYQEESLSLCIICIICGGDLVGIAPCYVDNNGKLGPFTLRRLMFLGTREGAAQSEYMDFIMHPLYEATIVEETMRLLASEDICDELLLEKIDESSSLIPLLRQTGADKGFYYHVRTRFESPFVKLPPTYDEFLKQAGANVRHKIRNNQKKLQKYTTVVYRKTENHAELETDFADLTRLHQLRWESRKLPGSFSRKNYITFHQSIMKEMMENGRLELWFLAVDGKAIAALYNISYNNKIYNYQAGVDTEFDGTIAPGFLLHHHCIAEAINKGLHEYDFLAMGKRDAYKKNWTDESHYMTDIYMARPGVIKYMAASLVGLRFLYRWIKAALKSAVSLKKGIPALSNH